MKKKLIGIGVASLGILLSIGGAIALYEQAANDTGFGISAGTYAGSSGSVAYKINNTAGNSSVAPLYMKEGGSTNEFGLGGEYFQVYYEFNLSAAFADGAIAQNFVVGNVSINISNIPEAYQGKLSIWAEMNGYGQDTLGAATYNHVFMSSDYAITAEAPSFAVSKDVAVAANGEQTVRLYMKYDLEGLDLYTLNEASLGYTLNVTWGEASDDFGRAYVRGVGTLWEKDDGYSMAPNINKPAAEGWQWVYNNLPGSFGGAKCSLEAEGTWSAGDDAELDSAKTYDVYWSGSNEAAANFAEQA